MLAGFSLAAIAQVVTAERPPELADWVILAFACSVALLLHAMQAAVAALATDPSPITHLNWNPEAQVDETALAAVREQQITKYQEMMRYWYRANISYDLGLNAFLAGVVLLLIPHEWSGPRIAAVAAAAVALLLEMWWALSNRLERLPHPVFGPSREQVEVARLSSIAAASILDPERRRLAQEFGNTASVPTDPPVRPGAAAGDRPSDPD